MLSPESLSESELLTRKVVKSCFLGMRTVFWYYLFFGTALLLRTLVGLSLSWILWHSGKPI